MKKETMIEQVKPSEMAIPEAAMDFFAQENGGAENMEHVKNPFFAVSTRGSRFKIGEELIGNSGVEFFANIIKIGEVRGWYKQKYDPGKPQPPDCGSVGGVAPDAESREKQCDLCARCPWNKWGTGTDADGNPSRGKACKQSKRLVLNVRDIDLPVLLSFPPTSHKFLEKLLKTCTIYPGVRRGVPVWAVVCKFSFDPQVSYPRPVVDFVEVVTDIARLNELKDMHASPVYAAATNAYATEHDLANITEDESPREAVKLDPGDVPY